jgi:hypothetical protein
LNSRGADMMNRSISIVLPHPTPPYMYSPRTAPPSPPKEEAEELEEEAEEAEVDASSSPAAAPRRLSHQEEETAGRRCGASL